MSIFDNIKEWKKENFPFERYEDAISITTDLYSLVKDGETIQEYFNHWVTNESLDLVYDYFYLKKYASFTNLFPLRDNEDGKKATQLINYASKKFDEINDKNDFIKIIKKNWDQIFVQKNYSFKNSVFDFCCENKDKFDQTFIEKLIKNNTNIIVQFFPRVEQTIKNNVNLSILFCNVDTLKTYLDSPRLDVILKIVSKFKNYNDERVKQNFLEIEKYLREKAKVLLLKIENIDEKYLSDGNWLLLEEICNFFILNLFSDLEEWKKIKKKIKDNEKIYLEKYGQKHEFKVDQEQQETLNKVMKETFSNIDTEWAGKIWSLTHRLGKDKQPTSNWADIGKKQRTGIIDFIRSRNEDDYFFNSKLNELQIVNHFTKHIIFTYYFNNEENTNKFFMQLLAVAKHAFAKAEIGIDNKEWEKYFRHLEILYILLHHTLPKNELNLQNESLQYAIISYECGLIEKILKLFYIRNFNEKWYKKAYLTLNQLLDINSVLKDVIGIDNIKIMRYYLLLINGIGFNIRNKIAHFDFDDEFQETVNYNNCLLILLVLITILNELAAPKTASITK